MARSSIVYSDLSKKQIQFLKDFYVEKKVNGMSHKELKEFVYENISHQIHGTIGKEEEIEAWEEISDYFGEEFETIISEIQCKFNDNKDINIATEKSKKEMIDLIERNITNAKNILEIIKLFHRCKSAF